MLLELNIKNFAIIEDLNVQFTKGLNIITGETGSGKSILIEALGIILGSRSSKEYIRTGKKKASLEAVFYIKNHNIIDEILEDYSIPIDLDRIIVISKEISQTGASLSKVNGKNVNLTMLKEITKKLVDIFGQHEHQSLLDVSNHKVLLDSFGDESFKNLKREIRKLFLKLKNEKDKLDAISIDLMERDREIDMLKFQIDEILEANLDKEKDLNLELEYKKMLNINNIRETFSKLLNSFNGETIGSIGIIDSINNGYIDLEKIKNLDKDIDTIYNRFKNIKYEIEDLNRECINFIDSIDFDENQLIEKENRLNLINKLKNKYGNTIEEILQFELVAEDRLHKLMNQEKEIKFIQNEIKIIENDLAKKSNQLTNIRKKLARKLENNIQLQLEELNMNEVKFKVNFGKNSYYTIDGLDKVEFLISTNAGEELKPLSKIASGGEMSRIMLAFKSILAKYDNIQTMIFDEIDTGISGGTAQIVGEKIYQISTQHQVICISHLPQITALADSHYVIGKETINGKTVSYIEKLDDENRVKELARLIGGLDLTETTMKNALEMIEKSKDLK